MGFGGRWPEAKIKALAERKAGTTTVVPAAGQKPGRTKKTPAPGAKLQLTVAESERQLQTKCHQAFLTWAPSLTWVLSDGRQAGLGWMNKNDGKKTERAAGIDKAQGLTPGVPDWQLAVARRGYSGLFVEFKTLTGNPSEAQLAMHPQLEAQGYLVVIIRTLPAFCQLLRWYLGPEIFKLNA